MPRYKATIAYDGTNYSGFQRQTNSHTIQAEIEATLKRFNNQKKITIHPSGRTDAGVHALGQVIHFDYPADMPTEKFRFALDTQTPKDIAFVALEKVSDQFHARYDAKEKIYQYRLDFGHYQDPFKRDFYAYYPFGLKLEPMQEAIQAVIGTHDFSAFCASGSAIKKHVRTIKEAHVEAVSETELIFTFRGNGFLYNMVRIIVGTLLKIGNEQWQPEKMAEIIASRDRQQAGPTAHPEGLYLIEVIY